MEVYTVTAPVGLWNLASQASGGSRSETKETYGSNVSHTLR